jgi:hypothetical protein
MAYTSPEQAHLLQQSWVPIPWETFSKMSSLDQLLYVALMLDPSPSTTPRNHFNPLVMSRAARVGMAAPQPTHTRTKDEQLQETREQRERTVSPEPENRVAFPENRLDPEITDAALSLIMFQGTTETEETSLDMRELIRRVESDGEAKRRRIFPPSPASSRIELSGARASASARPRASTRPRPRARRSRRRRRGLSRHN